MSNFPTAQQAHTLAHANLLSVFSERDPAARMVSIKKTYHADAQFCEDGAMIVGHEAISHKAGEILDGKPGWGFVPHGNVKHSGEVLYLAWGFGPVDGDGKVDVKATGSDVILVEDGLIKRFWVLIDGVNDVKL